MKPRKPRLPMPPGEWRPVPGFEDYYWISDRGQIFTQPRKGSVGGFIKIQRSTNGYPAYTFWGYGRVRTRAIHILMAEAFIGPRPEGMEVRHLNGDKTDNRLENLAYGTHSENMLDTVRHGTNHWAKKTHCVRGHAYDEANTYINPSSGGRRCRTCHRESSRRAVRAA